MERPVAVITGASSGIGLEFARQLAKDHDLVLVARRRDRLEQAAEELQSSFGAKVSLVQADLTVEEDLRRVAECIEQERGLALLVNNAGFGARGLFWESSLEVQEAMHRLHIMATLRLSHVALRNLTAREAAGATGRLGIINVASVAAFLTGGNASYCSTKAWMTSFTEGVALDLKAAGSRVRAQAFCPGFTYSEFHEAMGVEREAMAVKALWMTAEAVVAASLAGFAADRVYVVPGWRYKLLVALVPRLPARLRMAVTSAGRRRMQRQKG